MASLCPKLHSEKGQFLVEILIAIGITSALLPALITGFIASREGKAQQKQRSQAVALLRETEEAVRSVRQNGDWVTFAVNGTFYPVVSGGEWSLASGSATIGDFTQGVLIEDVERDTSGDIVSSGGVVDPSTKQLTITISWGSPFPSNVQSVLYLTRHDNVTHEWTTEADFDDPGATLTGVTVVNNLGGEVVLGAGGGGDWCSPSLSVGELDLPKSGVANALTAIEGEVFAGTGDNASGESYVHVDVSDPENPTLFSPGTIDGYKTNDVFGTTGFGYIATDTNSAEVVIIDLTDMSLESEINLPGNIDATGLFVSGNVLYATGSNGNLYSVDVSDKASPSILDSDGVSLGGAGLKVFVRNDYAYVAISGSPEMQIVDVSDPSDMQVVGNADVDANLGVDVYVNETGTRAYLATGASPSQDELFLINIETKTGSRSEISSYDTDGMSPNGVTVVPGGRAIIVGDNGVEYQVVNILDENNIFSCGSVDVDSGVNDVASVIESDDDAYSYIVTGDADSELKIIEGGPGGGYSDTGVYESATYTLDRNVAFNRLFVNFDQPPQTSVSFQVAVEDPSSGDCADATFASSFRGRDSGTGNFSSSDFYTEDGIINLVTDGDYNDPGLCFRFRAYLQTMDSAVTPTLYDVIVNHSP